MRVIAGALAILIAAARIRGPCANRGARSAAVERRRQTDGAGDFPAAAAAPMRGTRLGPRGLSARSPGEPIGRPDRRDAVRRRPAGSGAMGRIRCRTDACRPAIPLRSALWPRSIRPRSDTTSRSTGSISTCRRRSSAWPPPPMCPRPSTRSNRSSGTTHLLKKQLARYRDAGDRGRPQRAAAVARQIGEARRGLCRRRATRAAARRARRCRARRWRAGSAPHCRWRRNP